MKKLFIILAAATLFTACQESLEERAAREAREVTEAKCPMRVETNLFLDSIVFDIPSLTQTQYFRFIGMADNDSIVAAISANEAKAALVQELKNTPNYKQLMERGVNFRYVYRSDANHEKVYLNITLTKEDYQ